MRVFISWSGERSRAVALALRKWLPDVVQDIQPFMSENDIGAGARWALELAKQLETADLGVICLTPENLNAPWLLFEAGSVAKKLEATRVIPYRMNLKATEVSFPLAQFQSVDANREGTLKLLKTLNSFLKQPLEVERIERLFARLWKDLEEELRAVSTASVERPSKRSDTELLEEILQIVRNSQRESIYKDLRDFDDRGFEHVGDERSARFGVTAEVYWHEAGFTRDEAIEVCGMLKSQGIPSRLAEHRDKKAPDAAFIGALVPAEAARIALGATPYGIQYIFRPDYPEEPGGSDSGYKIGIGYRSTHLVGHQEAVLRPVQLSETDLRELMEAGISNVEFQRRLRRITGAE